MPNPRRRDPKRVADMILLSAAALMVGPIVIVALAPVILTIGVLWPLIVLPILALGGAFRDQPEYHARREGPARAPSNLAHAR